MLYRCNKFTWSFELLYWLDDVVKIGKKSRIKIQVKPIAHIMNQRHAYFENGGTILGNQVLAFPFSLIRDDEIHL